MMRIINDVRCEEVKKAVTSDESQNKIVAIFLTLACSVLCHVPDCGMFVTMVWVRHSGCGLGSQPAQVGPGTASTRWAEVTQLHI